MARPPRKANVVIIAGGIDRCSELQLLRSCSALQLDFVSGVSAGAVNG